MSDDRTTGNEAVQPAGLPAVTGSGVGDMIRAYHEIEAKLMAYRRCHFRHRGFVKVDCSQFHGYGFAVLSSDVPPDRVAVHLENGNTWWYPIDAVVSVTDLQEVPRSVRRQKLRYHGYKLLAGAW